VARQTEGRHTVSARLVLPGTASETEWLEARRQGITASEIAIVMGLSPYSSPYALYWRKRGDLPAEEDKAVFERGHVLEPYIAMKFEKRHPEFRAEGDGRSLYAHQERPWQLATPDRLLFECQPSSYVGNQPLAVLEAKTDAGEDTWGDEGTDEIPVHYRCQVLWQMDVMGVTTGYVACLLMRQWKIRVYELTMDGQARDDLELMDREARRFLQRIDRGDPPEVDWRPATGQALRRLHPSVVDKDMPVRRSLATSYRAAVRRYDEAKQRKALLSNRVLEAIGDGRRAVDERTGEPIATRSASEPKRVNGAQLRAEYPAAAAACTHGPEHPEIKLTPAKPKEPKP
jgi:putative phage-type endonuclease